MSDSDVRTGPDGRVRCAWGDKDEVYRHYHDTEWGHPVHGDRPLYEKLSLEGFQAGLSWSTILHKRDRFREVFAGFDPVVVAAFADQDVVRLMADPGIIRNRSKIQAAIGNARIVVGMAAGELDEVMWSFAPRDARPRPRTLADVPAVTPESEAMSQELRRRGFRFVGPTTMYALMQSSGMVDDHVEGCWRTL